MSAGEASGRRRGGADEVFRGGGDVGRDLARVDWAATPLGPPEGWPQSLRTALSILLSSRFAMWLAWGPELTFFCNAAYRRDTLGRKYPWALGRPASEVWAEVWGDVESRVETVLTTGQSTWDEALLLFLERSGYPEETYHTFSYSPLRDDGGAVVGMLCVVSEDTERVVGDRRMATLRDLGSDPSVVRTEEQTLAFCGQVLARNQRDLPFTLTYLCQDDGGLRLAAATGIDPGHPAAPERLPAGGSTVWPVAEAAAGRTVPRSLDGAEFADLPTGAWPDPPQRALVVPLRQQGSAPHGFLVAALNRYRPLDDEYRGFVELVAGHLAAGIASARSYRAQQRRAEELAELDRAKTTFFSNISHEFRTPLTLLLGPVAELLDRPTGLDRRARADLEVVHRNGLRLNKLVNMLLDFSRIEAGGMRARFEPVDLAATTAELASVFRSAVERAGLVFDVDCRPLPEPVHVDPAMWEQVVLNLLSNALKFTFEGTIRVGVRDDGDHAVVTVSDTGVGVPPEELPRLFERFHRIENAWSRSHEGSGIGLAMVRELVGLHGGVITADSPPGAGTTFTIRLPLGIAHLPAEVVAPGPDRPAVSGAADPYLVEALRWPADPADGPEGELAADPGPDGARGSPARLVVADDNADMREYLTRVLTDAGHRVLAVPDGQRALEVVRAEPPDLVVSDVMMPRLDGLALVAALRADPRTATVPVVLLSARAGPEASIEGLRAGADDYLVKPFTAAELVARVRASLELTRLRSHQARWRSALVDSLQEAFFVADAEGRVLEINSAFTDILGYGPEDLPYGPTHPWWPDAATEPDAHRQLAGAFAALVGQPRGNYTVPVTHRDGHRVWVSGSFTHLHDPDTGRRVSVGTFRDVTAEHYGVRQQAALAALNQQLAQADGIGSAVGGAVAELRRVWDARRVLAVLFPTAPADPPPDPVLAWAGPPTRWTDLSAEARRVIAEVRDGDQLSTVTAGPGAAGIALHHPDGVLVLWIELPERRPFTARDQTLLAVLAGRLGQGLARVRQLDEQRETALALQHAILGPARLPAGFAARYQPATRPLQVGGEWYDVVSLDDGRIALAVGDCVGHGLSAATVMGQLRSACRALLLEHPDPAAALAGMDQFAARLPGAQCTTAFCAVLDPRTGELRYSSAGHPPPVLVSADRAVRFLDGGRGVPLGVRVGRSRSETRVVIPPRATLLLYTDGLVERRRRPLDEGVVRAAEVVRDGGDDPPEVLADRLMSRLAPGGGYDDDVALLLCRLPGALDLELSADLDQLAPARRALRGWLTRCGLDPHQVQDVLVATGEALANAIEHGHRHTPGGRIRLAATAAADQLHVTVTDTGAWQPPRSDQDGRRGRGIALMRALVDEVEVRPSSGGTAVHLHTRIA